MNSFYDMVKSKLDEVSNLEHNLRPCVDIYRRYSYNINTFCTYNFSDYLYMLYIGAYLDDFSYHIRIIDKYKDNFDRVNASDLDRLIDLYNAILISYNSNNSLLISNDSYLNQLEEFNNKPFSSEVKILLKKLFTVKDEKLDFEFYNIFFKDFLNENDKSIFLGIIEIYKIKYIKEYASKVKVEKAKVTNKAIKRHGDIALKVLDLVMETKKQIEGEYNSFQRLKSKQVNLFKNLLNDIKTNEYIDIEKYRKLLDPDVLLELLFYNSQFYNRDYEEEKTKFVKSDTDELEEYLLKENINIDLTKVNVETDVVINKLNILSKVKEIMKYNNILLHIINNISLENLTNIIGFMNEKIYDEKFLLDNIMCLKNDDEVNKFIKNIEVLNSNGINVSNVLKFDVNILFSDNEKLSYLLSIYKSYNINLNSGCYNFEWLQRDMSYIIDKFIEIGQYNLIINNLSLLNSNSDIIVKRCILYKMIGNEVINEQNKLRGNLRKEENFIVNDKILEETVFINYDLFIPSDVIEVLKLDYVGSYDLCDLDCLKNNIKDEYRYEINGIIISKNKIIKNLNNLLSNSYDKKYDINELIMYSMLYGYPMLLTRENINDLRKIFNIKTKTLSIN